MNILEKWDTLDHLETGKEWDEALSRRIMDMNNAAARKKQILPFQLVMVLFIMMNTLIFFYVRQEPASHTNERTELLNTISDELLINAAGTKE